MKIGKKKTYIIKNGNDNQGDKQQNLSLL